MKITLWYESHNAHERLAAKYVAAKFPGARLVDVSTWTAMRDRPSESGSPDRHVRAFPCLVFDTDDGEVELERIEESLTSSEVDRKESLAKGHESRVDAALAEASERTDEPGGARPIRLNELRRSADAVDPGESQQTGVVAIAAATRATAPRKKKS
ncbi:MAG: hypothetical protein FD180_4295 [Planctomycetota bacterium]|nr:MAG: hypothetical protein FD180_4295 [Planctomycetota bacterium]